MLDLRDLLKYKDIIIQCHDNPDADALASGLALYTYFKANQKEVRFVYGGHNQITKPNLKIMIEELHIPIEYVKVLHKPELIITVDAQPNGGNITFFQGEHMIAIDHHIPVGGNTLLNDIRPDLGSCSTLVWDLLFSVDFDINRYQNVATALYYGLLTDTNFFAEIRHPLDKDMLDLLEIDESIIRKLKNSNLSFEDLETAGISLIRCSMNNLFNVAVLESRPCDPNVLGFISDLAIQVDNIYICIVYYDSPQGIKYSVRSCTKEVKANEFAQYIAQDVGSGGGHIDKAGGFISRKAYEDKYASYNAETYFHTNIKAYFESFDIIHTSNYVADLSNMKLYCRKDIVVGYVSSTSIFPNGTPMFIRTLEGDLEFIASPEIYIVVGIEGEIQPMLKEKFERSYEITDQPFDISFQYTPVAKNRLNGKSVYLIEHIKPCKATDTACVYARPLTKNIKIFTAWDTKQYLSGLIGDYLIVGQDDLKDISVIQKNIFHKTYQLVK